MRHHYFTDSHSFLCIFRPKDSDQLCACVTVSVMQSDIVTMCILTGEASASTMWDNQAWSYLLSDREEKEPPFLAQDFIHTVQPGAKIIVMLRDPVERYCREILTSAPVQM